MGEPSRIPSTFLIPRLSSQNDGRRGLAIGLPRFAYYPFGGGNRICIGQSFALMEATIILAGMGQRYRFTLHPKAVIKAKPQITLMPANGITKIRW
jgi:cytochrome P450